MTRVWTLAEALADGLSAIEHILAEGGVVILPTDTIYGLHARAEDPGAVRSVFEIKVRDRNLPLAVIGSSLGQLETLGVRAAPDVRAYLASVWPAPLTAVVPLAEPIAPSAGRATLACRVPALDWLRELAGRVGPLVSTSVNLSGEPPARAVSEVPVAIVRRVAAVIDAGTLHGEPSTIVEFANGAARVLRAGAMEFSQNLWKRL